MKSFREIIEGLEELKKQGFIKTHRAGNTGIGKTLEDLLDIDENNIAGPNAERLELKSGRKGSATMLTLFTKSPDPKGANARLLEKFGYPSGRGRGSNELHTTVTAVEFNKVKGGKAMKLDVAHDRVLLVEFGGKELCYWPGVKLRSAFERKMPELMYVKAECHGSWSDEEFWFNEAFVLRGFSFARLLELIREGVVVVDIRIGQYPDGRSHDHGTGFRVRQDDLDRCFQYRTRIM